MGYFEDKLFDRVKANGLFDGVNRALLAVSGGADSVAMAYALHQLRQEGRLRCDFVVGHVNHSLRGVESDTDEVFVQDLGRSLGIDVVTAKEDVPGYAAAQKLSVETAARTVRLKALAAMAEAKNCDAVAAAHHKDDLAETMIHRLMRGTGFRGLCGIRPVSRVYGTRFIRPMLDIRRSEIIRYCQGSHLEWREDASNRVVNFTRNRIRHRLLPAFENGGNAIVERLAVLSFKSRLLLTRIEEQSRRILEKGQLDKTNDRFTIEQDFLRNCPPWVLYEVIRQVMVSLNVGLRDYKQEHFDSIRRLVKREKAKAGFPGGIEMVVEKGRVSVRRENNSAVLSEKIIILEIGQTVQFGQWKIASRLLKKSEVNFDEFLKTKDSFVEWLDGDKITGHLEIRRRQKGDQFWPIGAKSPKKVARFLLDSGLGANTKENTFIIQDAEKILWLAPVRMSELVKVTEHTRRILQFSVNLI